MSDLRTRLARLGAPCRSAPREGEKRDAGADPRSRALGPPASLADRIATLSVRAARPDPKGPTEQDIACMVGGSVAAPMLIEIEHRYCFPFVHGTTSIDGTDRLVAGVRVSARLDRSPGPGQLLFLDTETTGLAGGSGTLAFLIGLGRVRADGLIITQFVLTGFGGEHAMLERVHAAAQASQHVISFNGKSFDLPLLKARARLAGLAHPYDAMEHLDLLHVARRRLREAWPDCRLRTVEERTLGLVRADDLPGREVPAAFQRWLQRRDPVALPRILAHNREDLVSLAGLLTVLAEPTAREAPLLRPARCPPMAATA